MRVLIVKTSSMGDVIHTLPAVTDAVRAIPGIVFDWVVEENFAEIPAWHPAVSEVIPVAVRRWRKQLIQTIGSAEWKQFKVALRKHHYDLVIDAQGLLKSAWIVQRVKAPAAGYDKYSVREAAASWFYQNKYAVAKDMHAVERTRELFAQALHYNKPDTRGDYGIDPHRFYGSSRESANIVFLHATTRDDKHYPQSYWRILAEKLTGCGYRIRLPWGTEAERDNARKIAEGIANVEVLPRLNLQGVASVLAQASAVVTVDTGLGHMAASLNIPAVSLYGPTSPGLVGAYGDNQIHLSASDYVNSDINKDSSASPATVSPAIFAPLKPEVVVKSLQKLIPDFDTTPTSGEHRRHQSAGEQG